MAAAGKGRINATSIALDWKADGPNPRIVVASDGKGHAGATTRKTGQFIAEVTDVTIVQHDENGRPTRTRRYAISTTAGEIIATGAQTFLMASEVKADDNTDTTKENDVTVTVKRGAGRPAAKSKTSRAAQRTPLPPKGTEGSPETVEKTTRRRRAAITGFEESPTPRPKSTVKATRRTRSADQIQADHDAVAGPKVAKSRAKKSAKTAAIPADFPGLAKAQAFADYATEHGWETSIDHSQSSTIVVTATSPNGDQTITATWINGTVTPQFLPAYTSAGRVVKLRNISAARKQIDGTRPDVAPVPHTKTTKRAARPGGKAAQAEVTKRAPFDLEAASDEEIISRLRGRQIQWRNRISGMIQEAVVGSTSSPVRIDRTPNGERAVTFNEPRGGARSVNLKYLLDVK